MIETQPETFLIAEPVINTGAVMNYLHEVGGEEWLDRLKQEFGPYIALSHGELLSEFCGRLCYKSWVPGLNKNVTKIRADRGDYLLNVLRSKHGSVLEHAHYTFAFHNISRVATAELNRHRAGIAISEQSLRYVRIDKDIPFRLPRNVLSRESCEVMEAAVQMLEEHIRHIYSIEGIESEEDFASKKIITSAVRRIAPLGMSTEEVWTANIRAIRHVIEMRTDTAAEEEIRIIGQQVAEIMYEKCPLLFQDYTVEDGHWKPETRKV